MNKKENIIKEYNKKNEGIMKKYEEEKNRNKNLTIEIKELNLKYKRVLDERNRLIQNNDKDLTKSEINLINQSKNNNSIEMNQKGKETVVEKTTVKSSNKLLKVDKYLDNFSDIEEEKYIKKLSSKNKEINEDYISISDSLSNENEIINNKTKENISNKNEKDDKDSETISEDNPELLKEVEKIMNINKIDKNFEKTNSSFKDDKSTKLEISKI